MAPQILKNSTVLANNNEKMKGPHHESFVIYSHLLTQSRHLNSNQHGMTYR